MDISNRTVSAIGKRDDAVRRWYKSGVTSIKAKRDVEDFVISFDNGTMLFASVTAGDLEETERILNLGTDPNYSNADGLTSLHQACIDENLEMVVLLIKFGADVNANDNENWTPLHAAASSTSLEVIKYLVENGADLSAVNSDDDVPIDLAEEQYIKNYLNKEMHIRGINVDDARSSIRLMMMSDMKKWIADNKLAKAIDSQGATILHIAASKGYTDVIEALVASSNVDINATDKDGWSALHAAVYWKQKDAISALISNGANVYQRTNSNLVPADLADQDVLMFYKLAVKRCSASGSPYLVKNSGSASQLDVPVFPHMYKKPVKPILKQPKIENEQESDKNVEPLLKKEKNLTSNFIPKPSLPPIKMGRSAHMNDNADDSKAEISSYDLATELQKPPTLPPSSRPATTPITKPVVDNPDDHKKISTPNNTDVKKNASDIITRPLSNHGTSNDNPGIKLPSNVQVPSNDKPPVSDSSSLSGIKLPPSGSSSVSFNSSGIKLPPSTGSKGLITDINSPVSCSSGIKLPPSTGSKGSPTDINSPASSNSSGKKLPPKVQVPSNEKPDLTKLSSIKLPPKIQVPSNEKLDLTKSPGIKLPPKIQVPSNEKPDLTKSPGIKLPPSGGSPASCSSGIKLPPSTGSKGSLTDLNSPASCSSGIKLPPSTGSKGSLTDINSPASSNSSGIKLPLKSHISSNDKPELTKSSGIKLPPSTGRDSSDSVLPLNNSEAKSVAFVGSTTALSSSNCITSFKGSDLNILSNTKSDFNARNNKISLNDDTGSNEVHNSTGSSTNEEALSVMEIRKRMEKNVSFDEVIILKKKYADSQKDIYNLRSRINDMKKEIENLKQQNETLSNNVANIDKLKKENERLTKENTTLIQAMTTRKNQRSH